ncbi:MAG: sugar ABC transporter permease, partial [Verrucomicrobiota bacterium]|nr:sugar ABC transporter permease [Verrucomicrobiota bacterium]
QANGLGQAEYVGLAHYEALAGDERYYKAVQNSFTYTLASIVVIVPLALWLAHLLRATYRRLRPIFTFALLLPALTPPSVLAVLFLMVFYRDQGLLNQFVVIPFGFDPIRWQGDTDFILTGLVLQNVWRWTGFMTFFVLAGMEGIPKVYYEVARLATGSRWWHFWHVTLPQLRPVLLFVAIYLFVDGFSQFAGAKLLLGSAGGPRDAGLLTISYMNFHASNNDFGSATALSISLLPVMMVVLWAFLFVRRRTI